MAPSNAPADGARYAHGTNPTMEYAQPSGPEQQQQRIDYKTPFCATPVPVQCPVCKQRSVSKTKHVSGGYTL